MEFFKDISNQKFGKLKVLRISHRKDGRVYWLCECACNNQISVAGSNLRSGKTKSCGCLRVEKVVVTAYRHGYSKSKFYRIWSCMLNRCYNPDNNRYSIYGERGIKVCEEWKILENFYAWCVKSNFKEGLTLDRINVDGNYEPDNCRWATPLEQAHNKRNNTYVWLNGNKCFATDIKILCGMSHSCFYRYAKRYNNFQEAIDKWKAYKELK